MDIPKKLTDLAISETGFVFDPYTGVTFSLNASGLTILRCLKEGISRGQTVARLEEEFAVGGADLDRDIDELVHLLRQNGLVPSDFEI